jgi:hypothetical protein
LPPRPPLAASIAGNISGNAYTPVAGNIAGKCPARRVTGNGALILVMMEAGRWLSVTELAGLMGCSVGEASKRVEAAGDLVRCRREGRRKMVRLREMRMMEWCDLAASARSGTV